MGEIRKKQLCSNVLGTTHDQRFMLGWKMMKIRCQTLSSTNNLDKNTRLSCHDEQLNFFDANLHNTAIKSRSGNNIFDSFPNKAESKE
ncbi:hypothetical protein O181_015898 [Austropuccinia psidii MF-1]|uniref:Uncharacterized protein n=1 Tax=Austropuccinia psidii MF-1 TaxID=1389203 RepID=A0A9Q3GQD3_9BASI|nr:hypothetical protein [Austropuccinia psidii MF-1]